MMLIRNRIKRECPYLIGKDVWFIIQTSWVQAKGDTTNLKGGGGGGVNALECRGSIQ